MSPSDLIAFEREAKKKQVGGKHYDLPIQPIEYINKNGLGYIEGNVIKYVTRHKNKNGAEDIKKAIHYLELLLEEEYSHKSDSKLPTSNDSVLEDELPSEKLKYLRGLYMDLEGDMASDADVVIWASMNGRL